MKHSAAPPTSSNLAPPSAWGVTRRRLAATWRAMRDRPRTAGERLYLGLWLLYLACYPFAVAGVAFDVRANFSMTWAGSVLLLIQGALAVVWLSRVAGFRRGAWLALAVALGGWGGETVGVTTGWPFGRYAYSGILFPRLPGAVPLPVTGAWLLVVVGAVATTRRLVNPRRPFAIRLGVAALLGVALDLALEPVATRLEGYWVWQSHGPYYGIPTANFLGWAALCAILAGLTLWRLPPARPLAAAAPPGAAPAYPLPTVEMSGVWLYALTGAMFAAIDLTHGLWLAALVGVATLAWLVARWRRGI
jgi:putative membrane protein